MELTDAKLCSDCNRIFDASKNEVCPWCTCEHGFKVSDYLPPMWKAKGVSCQLSVVSCQDTLAGEVCHG